jgi:hypothetical protein
MQFGKKPWNFTYEDALSGVNKFEYREPAWGEVTRESPGGLDGILDINGVRIAMSAREVAELFSLAHRLQKLGCVVQTLERPIGLSSAKKLFGRD